MQEISPKVTESLIYCGMIKPEIEAAKKGTIDGEALPDQLHLRPDSLREQLQKSIDQKTGYDFIVLCFGLCGMSAVGLHSEESRLVIPKVDD
jgi:hypothetical protein